MLRKLEIVFHFSLDSKNDFKSGCQRFSHQQQFFSELLSYLDDDDAIRTTDTPWFKPFAMIEFNPY